jgi:hypothetical protein
VPKETAVPFYENGDARIRYEMVGSGFPLLVTPGGGLNSRVSNWPTAVFNAMEAFKDDFRCITMDQRNASGGESTGPIPASDPWGAFADIAAPAPRAQSTVFPWREPKDLLEKTIDQVRAFLRSHQPVTPRR